MSDEHAIPTAENDREVVRLWRCWRTLNEMLKDRGYDISDDEVAITLEEFRSRNCERGIVSRSKLTVTAVPSIAMIEKYATPPTRSNPTPTAAIGPVYDEFSRELAMGTKTMRTFAQHVSSNSFYTGILVTQTALSAQATKIIPTVLPSIIETFQEQDLLVNITRHELVPVHLLLSYEEKKKLLERYRLKETQLPRIQVGDPVARYMGLRRGNVVKIIRKSETAGRYATYRWTI